MPFHFHRLLFSSFTCLSKFICFFLFFCRRFITVLVFICGNLPPPLSLSSSSSKSGSVCFIFFIVGLFEHLLSPSNFFPPPSVLIFLQSPSPPPSISTSEQKKAIDNHATTFCCRLRPIRANHSTVGVVARRLLCVWLVAAWEFGLGGGGKGQPSVCLPVPPAPPAPPVLPRGSA